MNKQIALVICGPWRDEYAKMAYAEKTTCKTCGAYLVTDARNKQQMLKFELMSLCTPCFVIGKALADSVGKETIMGGFLVGGEVVSEEQAKAMSRKPA